MDLKTDFLTFFKLYVFVKLRPSLEWISWNFYDLRSFEIVRGHQRSKFKNFTSIHERPIFWSLATNLGTTFKAPTNLGALEFLGSEVTRGRERSFKGHLKVMTSMMLIFSYPCMIYIVGKLLPSAFRIYGHLKIIWRSTTFRWPLNDLWGHQLQVPKIWVLWVLWLLFSKRLIPHFFRRSFRIFSNFTMLNQSPRTGTDGSI